MIGRLQGILLARDEGEVLLDVGGVGYEVEVPDTTLGQLPELGRAVVLHTHFVVREDAQQLYGFYELQDRSLFRLLIKVNGVGPKLALGILSCMDSAQFVGCVLRNDVNALVKLPGIGRKTAERLVLDLRDRLQGWDVGAAAAVPAPVAAAGRSDARQEAEAALLSLGYKPPEAARAVMNAVGQLEQAGQEAVTENIIRAALKQLGRA
jgi:Holliday junction DNA helicase RuvA